MQPLRWRVNLGSSRRPQRLRCARSTWPGPKEERRPPRTGESRPFKNRSDRGPPLMDEAILSTLQPYLSAIVSYRADFVIEPVAGNDLGAHSDQEGFDSWDSSTEKSPS